MQDPSQDRVVFEDYATRLFEEVHAHKDESNIEIETVFRRWKPNVVIQITNKNNEKMVYCGEPTVEKLDGGNYLLIPSEKCVLQEGIEIFGMADLNNLGESVQFTAVKVYVAIVNNKANEVYHLFPSLSAVHRRSFVDNLAKVYANLAKTSDDLIPNYILKSVRSAGLNPKVAAPAAFRNVINQLVQKAYDKEKRLVKSQIHAHQFGADEFECIYKRFKYLSEQAQSGVVALHKSRTVDITVHRNVAKPTNNTRISLHGQKCFDAYCKLFKELKGADDIIHFVQSLSDAECDIIHKREMQQRELKTLQDAPCYNGFKFNVKREDIVPKSEMKKVLTAFFDEGVHHTYRYKRRYSFDCNGFTMDLTMVLTGEDVHPVFKPSPFVALEQMRKEIGQYEFEIEYTKYQQDGALKCLTLMDECLRAMRKDTYYFGNHLNAVFYPLFSDASQSHDIVRRFNALVCHGDKKLNQSGFVVNNNVGPNVVNLTHSSHNYIRHHFNDYAILMKTDGLRCIAYVEKKHKLLHLFVQNATYLMSVRLQNTPSEDYVLDGELYTQNNKSSYFVFDVYQKGEDHLLTKPLQERLDALTDDLLTENDMLFVQKKVALYLTKYQELYKSSSLQDNDHLHQMKAGFECVDYSGMKANDDGFILMHSGPLVRDITVDEEEAIIRLHGTKPYIMRLQEFQQGTHSINSMSRMQQGAYICCLKWKPEEECTIDFKVRLLAEDSVSTMNKKQAFLCSKYNSDSELNLYTMIEALSTGKVSIPLCPYTESNKIQTFQPAEVYDYELREPLSQGVYFTTDTTSAKIFTEKREMVRNNDIVEMRYNKHTENWIPMRLRKDKTEPNAYSVALANWKNIFHPVVPPLHWTPSTTFYDTSNLVSYYKMRKQNAAFSQLDNIHLLLKQHVIFCVSRVWSTIESRGKLKVFEVACGKGSDLFHWNYVHTNIRSISFYLGTDYDKSGLVRYDGAYHRYLRGNNNQRNTKCQTLDDKYAFDALFVQADARLSLQHCRESSWDRQHTQNVSHHKLDYEVLRYVLFGKTPENSALSNVLHEGMVHPTYNIVSCQFALHFLADHRHAFWENVNRILTVNGLFVATVPNGDFIAEQMNKSTNNTYVVPIRDARNHRSIVQWYKYEASSNKNMVFFQTPKISRAEEPLLRKESVLKTIRKFFDVVFFDTFAEYVSKQKLDIYKTSSETKGVFHSASINKVTLSHDFKGTFSHLAQKVNETPEALRYSQCGHYVIVLCKKNGHSEAELNTLRQQFM